MSNTFKANNKDTKTTQPSLLLTLNNVSSLNLVSIVNFENVIAGWVIINFPFDNKLLLK